MVLFTASCNEEDIMSVPNNSEKIYTLNLECCKPIFEESASRSESKNWIDGDELLIQFYDDNDRFPATATYNGGLWDMTVETGSFKGIYGECKIWYLDGNYSYDLIKLSSNEPLCIVLHPDANCCIYYAETQFELKDDGKISVKATLKPFMSRLRFCGIQNQSFIVKGFKVQSTDIRTDISKNAHESYFVNSDSKMDGVSLTCSEEIGGKYYTPYIYGRFPQYGTSEYRLGYDYISLKIQNTVFSRYDICSNAETNVSKTIVIPSNTNHDNWIMESYKVSTITIPEQNLNYKTQGWLYYGSFDSKTGAYAHGYADCSYVTTTTESDVRIYDIGLSAKNGNSWYYDPLIGVSGRYQKFPDLKIRGINSSSELGSESTYQIIIRGQNVKIPITTIKISNF